MIFLANVVIPSIAEHVIIMLMLLVPIALIEGAVLARRHVLSFNESLRLSFRANLRSTLLGLPLGYLFALVGIIPAGFFAIFLPERIRSVIAVILFNAVASGGTIPNGLDEVGFFLGTLLVMIPYFLVTLHVERKCIATLNPHLDNTHLTTTVRIMNDITYGLLVIPVVVGAVRAVITLMN